MNRDAWLTLSNCTRLCSCLHVFRQDDLEKLLDVSHVSSVLLQSLTLAFIRYCFTSKLNCGSQSSLYCPPTCKAYPILQYYCTTIAQHTPPPTDAPLYAIHHTILVIAISCKGQPSLAVARTGLFSVAVRAYFRASVRSVRLIRSS